MLEFEYIDGPSVRSSPAAVTTVTLIGLLFARPLSEVAKSQIIPHLDYFHRRSGERCDFRCAGYQEVETPGSDRISVGDRMWRFDADEFMKAVEEVERATTWQYSGGTELVLLNAKKRDSSVTLDASSAVVCQLDMMLAEKAIVSVETFVEQIFRYANEHTSEDPAWGFSDSSGKTLAKSALYHLAVAFLPESLRSDAERAKHFVIADISRT